MNKIPDRTGQKVVNAALKNEIVSMHEVKGMTFREIGEELGLALGTVKTHYYLMRGQVTAKPRIPSSPYPRYDDPPTLEGDALVIPDAEIPFHHAEFLNRVFDLADVWGIKQAIWAGDALHFDSLSGWEPNWAKEPNGGLSEHDEARLMEYAKSLPAKYQQGLIEHIVTIGEREADGGFSGEMYHARKVMAAINDLFNTNMWVLGNHEGRLLRAINSPVMPSELLNMMKLDEGRWSIAPFYFGILNTQRGKYRIEHPKAASKGAAEKLAAKFQCHILMGHSHLLRMDFDISGNYHACHIGHCVNEEMLAYAAQRSTTRDAHMLGAAIVRDGYLWVLNEHVDWTRLKNI